MMAFGEALANVFIFAKTRAGRQFLDGRKSWHREKEYEG